MKKVLTVLITLVFTAGVSTTIWASLILSLDDTRTESDPAGDYYLTGSAMETATSILYDAGFSIGTTPRFYTSNIVGAQVLFTGPVNVDFTAQELSDIEGFVNAGGGLVMIGEWGSYMEEVNPLAAVFGASYDPGPFGIGGVETLVNMTAPHPIWNGPAGSVTSYDQVYSSSVFGATGIGEHSSDPGEIALAVTTYGAGRVVFLTDANAWDDESGMVPPPPSNNAIVWENIFHWAAVPEPATMSLMASGCLGLLLLRRRRG